MHKFPSKITGDWRILLVGVEEGIGILLWPHILWFPFRGFKGRVTTCMCIHRYINWEQQQQHGPRDSKAAAAALNQKSIAKRGKHMQFIIWWTNLVVHRSDGRTLSSVNI